MTRSILLSAIALLLTAGAAEAATYYHGHRVRAVVVGQIDARPCPAVRGCLRAVVEIRWRRHYADHVVRCGNPRRLHVVGTYPFAGQRWVNVYACSRNYQWRLPR